MTDKMDMMPELTLTPDAAAVADAPAAAAEEAKDAKEAAEKEREANTVKLDEAMLSEAERKMVADFAEKIDITDSAIVLQYGAAAQKNIASFSENALNNVRTKDLGEIGDSLSGLVVELKALAPM